MKLLGLRTTIYPAPDLEKSKAWFTELLGQEPYFDQPFYVGYNVAGYELGLDPNADPSQGTQSYWGVPDATTAFAELIAHGATSILEVTDTGDGIRVARVRDPLGNVIGIIENPVFELPADAGSPGPGR
jgi:catechol 2,3-dioxygenase-like lactoylglutathione lyase family enzyme